MSVPVSNTEQPTSSANVRMVVVDEQRQPRYLARADELEQAILQVAGNAGFTSEDMPGLHGVCVEAARRAERHHR